MSRMCRRFAVAGIALATAAIAGACADSTTAQGTGQLEVRLTDAPFSTDLVSRVDVWVLRVDVRREATSDADADANLATNTSTSSGWTTVATPDQSIELLALQHGASAALGGASLAAGDYQSARLVIDPSRSSVTLKDGTVLTAGSSPGVTFPSAAQSGIKVNLDQPITIAADGTTTALVDFDVNQSFVMRGATIESNGLLFKPVVRGAVQVQ
jgi:uncharacterized protein DUF4382